MEPLSLTYTHVQNPGENLRGDVIKLSLSRGEQLIGEDSLFFAEGKLPDSRKLLKLFNLIVTKCNQRMKHEKL